MSVAEIECGNVVVAVEVNDFDSGIRFNEVIAHLVDDVRIAAFYEQDSLIAKVFHAQQFFFCEDVIAAHGDGAFAFRQRQKSVVH